MILSMWLLLGSPADLAIPRGISGEKSKFFRGRGILKGCPEENRADQGHLWYFEL